MGTEVPDESLALGRPGPPAGLVGFEHEGAGAAGRGGGRGAQAGEAGADDGDVGVGVHVWSTSGGPGM